ncbi:DUF934 domain-containing protein [Pusillimonas minor]|uniref:DUF934 domain-containing protein n=1 Tax=Pusillimonas minor TaxID=2697024 RepID=A0A842HR21_9BURK|nr:DUF934 domain-containing protein [Pusillimonas minor]MBC2769810.1 DUF934 domain-containing protein [Pusillimonas minor]
MPDTQDFQTLLTASGDTRRIPKPTTWAPGHAAVPPADGTSPLSPDTAPALPPDAPHWQVGLQDWLRHQTHWAARTHTPGLVLASDTDPAALAGLCATLPPAWITIEFPVYTDGRGFTLAQLLRTRHQWVGELRASGDVLIDTVFYLRRCGFDSYLLKPGHDTPAAQQALHTFTAAYQTVYPLGI